MIQAPAKKSLGQNFLQDMNIARKIVDALEPGHKDRVLEIGPGKGVLTALLADRAGLVLGVEKDYFLTFALDRCPGLQAVNMDALQLDWSRLDRWPGLKIIGNLPYNIAQTLLWDMAAGCRSFDRAVVMVQKEVAQRITAGPGGKEYGALSIWLQSFTTPRVLFNVSPAVFRPRPSVDSSVLELRPLPADKIFFVPRDLARVVKTMFQNRRKQLGRILKTYWNDRRKIALEQCGLDPRARPEQLSPEDFQGLSKCLFSE